MNFINFAEMAALSSEGFGRQEIITEKSGINPNITVTTIYAGKPNVSNPYNADTRDDWKIRRTIISDSGSDVQILEMWAEGSWVNRTSLTYKFL